MHDSLSFLLLNASSNLHFFLKTSNSGFQVPAAYFAFSVSQTFGGTQKGARFVERPPKVPLCLPCCVVSLIQVYHHPASHHSSLHLDYRSLFFLILSALCNGIDPTPAYRTSVEQSQSISEYE